MDGRDGVVVTGFVPDVRPFLERAAVFAAPMRFGSGLQNKILEAMSMEVPVVTSPLVHAGVQASADLLAPISVHQDPQDFAGALLDALRAAQSGGRPHAAGRQYVLSNFSWAEAASRLESAIRSIGHGSTT